MNISIRNDIYNEASDAAMVFFSSILYKNMTFCNILQIGAIWLTTFICTVAAPALAYSQHVARNHVQND